MKTGIVAFLAVCLWFPLGVARAQNAISTGTKAGFRMFYPGGNDWWLDPSKGNFDIRMNGGATPLATINALGNLGINKPNPVTAIDILGTASAPPTIQLQTINTTNPGVNLFNSAGALKFSYGYSPAQDIGFIGYGGNANLAINNNGNVGVGTTGPGAKLSVSGASAAGVLIALDNTNTAGYGVVRVNAGNADVGVGAALQSFGSGYGGVGANAANTASVQGWDSGGFSISANNAAGTIRLYTGGTAVTNERMRIDSVGNVGIGTTAPGQRLEVFNGAILQHNNNGARPGYQITYDNLGTSYILGMQNDGRFNIASYLPTDNFDPNNGSGINMLASGAVGIGLANPQAALDVNGSFRMSSGGAQFTLMTMDGGGLHVQSSASHILMQSGGNNVIIGGSADDGSGSRLQVNGYIESKSGGVIFPDGSTQSSAGAGLAGSGTFSASSSINITGLADGQDYDIVIVGTQQSAAAQHYLTINSAGPYDWEGTWHDATNAVNSLTEYCDSRCSTTQVQLTRDNPAAGTYFMHHLRVSSYSGVTLIQGRSNYKWSTMGVSTNSSEETIWQVHYSATALSSIHITATAGTVTGRYKVYKL